MDVRSKIAGNAGKPSYREYAWQQKLRFDYTPDDCKSFAAAIEKVVVPAASRIYEKRKRALGLDSLRPWDLVDGWFSRNPAWWSAELSALGFRLEAEPQALGFVFVPGLDPDPLPAFRDALYYTRGDSDLF
jgi:hypothetical protein